MGDPNRLPDEQADEPPKGSGDPEFEERLVRGVAELEAWLKRRSGVTRLGNETTDDLAQSICREALLARESYEHESSAVFKGWLHTLAKRKVADRVRFWSQEKREAGRRAPLQDEADTDGKPAEASADSRPDAVAEARELYVAIHRAIETLPKDQRRVLELDRLHGLSTEAIAAKLTRTTSAVRTLRSRALARLAELL